MFSSVFVWLLASVFLIMKTESRLVHWNNFHIPNLSGFSQSGFGIHHYYKWCHPHQWRQRVLHQQSGLCHKLLWVHLVPWFIIRFIVYKHWHNLLGSKLIAALVFLVLLYRIALSPQNCKYSPPPFSFCLLSGRTKTSVLDWEMAESHSFWEDGNQILRTIVLNPILSEIKPSVIQCTIHPWSTDWQYQPKTNTNKNRLGSIN